MREDVTYVFVKGGVRGGCMHRKLLVPRGGRSCLRLEPDSPSGGHEWPCAGPGAAG